MCTKCIRNDIMRIVNRNMHFKCCVHELVVAYTLRERQTQLHYPYDRLWFWPPLGIHFLRIPDSIPYLKFYTHCAYKINGAHGKSVRFECSLRLVCVLVLCQWEGVANDRYCQQQVAQNTLPNNLIVLFIDALSSIFFYHSLNLKFAPQSIYQCMYVCVFNWFRTQAWNFTTFSQHTPL